MFARIKTFTLLACIAAMRVQAAEPSSIPVYTAEAVAVFPHDREAFTQGLFFKDGFLYESTGLHGQSFVRKVQLETGEVQKQTNLPVSVFGEGIVDWGDSIISVTWTEQVGFVFGMKNFDLRKRFTYPGQGWGLTRSSRELVMSDGTVELRFLDPKSLRELRRVRVTANGYAIENLNELEWVDGEIYANIWQTNAIARIDPASGKVVGWIDLTGLLPEQDRVLGHTDVLNGIAYDAQHKRLFVTGKRWPKIFEIKLVKSNRVQGQ